jgi:dihydrofolate reductase
MISVGRKTLHTPIERSQIRRYENTRFNITTSGEPDGRKNNSMTSAADKIARAITAPASSELVEEVVAGGSDDKSHRRSVVQ